ncbi:phosphatase PAP2 family protein [Nocardioides sp. BP30]|uniref:phosphatase PAP2 family protein n=1 Tax=Nocardioides sp. BP30 TaxID=3036374 RepID=UPI0024690C56|nr:phosphatase PAP2 family protein [Nocardioides sp. BP30]WGL51070.1 phosphatase PAP2 family protein [Nocardioides sp. BP30]
MDRFRTRLAPALRELTIIGILYVGYSAARTLADGNLPKALSRAIDLERIERSLHLPGEQRLNRLATMHGWLGLAADYWYASLHYIVTAGVLLWLFRRSRDVYVPARRALAIATAIALGFYLTMPTAPPRMVIGFTDVMALHANSGWWGTDASAPKGLGGMTNELAAFPSMHAGWALWVALAIWSATRSRVLRTIGVVYAIGTALVVVATANHWAIDVIIGQAIILGSWLATHRRPRTAPVTVLFPRPPRRPSVGEAEAA